MAQTQVNTEFPIHNADGSLFHNIKLRNVVSDSVVMSLGDKITGDAYYIDNTLTFTMGEYIEVDVNLGGSEWRKVNYYLVNPPTVVKEGMVADNGDLKGMTKYSFEFYHPMYLLGNFPFTDVAVSSDELKYLSQNKKFSWIGKPQDFINKLNKNLQGTEWVVVMSSAYPQEKKSVLSEVLTFDNQTIADALKTAYDAWEVPYIVDSLRPNEYSYIDEHNVQRDYYDDGKRFVVVFGLPSNEIIIDNEPFVFHYGKGVGLKNNSRTPRNNKIVTRISGSGSERNIPYGYPQIRWYGNQDWDYTINNNPNDPHSYPIYKGIVGGQYVKLIKHPFTRKNLMPSIYSQTVFNKVSPYLSGGTTNPDYNPDTTIIDYYDAVYSQQYPYVNEINPSAPSFEIHEFEEVYPRLNEAHIIDAYVELDDDLDDWMLFMDYRQFINPKNVEAVNNGWYGDVRLLGATITAIENEQPFSEFGDGYNVSVVKKEQGKNTFYVVNYRSEHFQFNVTSLPNGVYDVIPVTWDDSMDDEGNYNQSYFHIKLPVLSFDLYACASITEQMDINMRSGACMGCTFTVQVDWEDYKKNFYDENGEFAPQGQQRDYTKYPDSSQGQIDVIVQKDIETFGTIMPNIYQQPKGESSQGAGGGDEFVFLGISLPLSYISNAEAELDNEMKSYMLENNVYYYDYPLKFDEAFLYEHDDIVAQIRPNTVIRFVYANEELSLFVKQLTIKYNEGVLPKYDITLTDNVEVVLNQIGQVAEDVEDLSTVIALLRENYGNNVWAELSKKLSNTDKDVARGVITFLQGLLLGNGDYGLEGNGNGNLRDIVMRNLTVTGAAHFFELIIDQVRATQGQIVISPANGKVVKVEKIEDENSDYYKLYFRATDGNRRIYQNFEIDDQIYCQTFNKQLPQNAASFYWCLCEDTSQGDTEFVEIDGELQECYWITINMSDCATGSAEEPNVGDEVVVLGNRTQAARQSAQILGAYNIPILEPTIQAPFFLQYEGINNYNLPSHRRNTISKGLNQFFGEFSINVGGSDTDIKNYVDNTLVESTLYKVQSSSTQIHIDKNGAMSQQQVTLSIVVSQGDTTTTSSVVPQGHSLVVRTNLGTTTYAAGTTLQAISLLNTMTYMTVVLQKTTNNTPVDTLTISFVKDGDDGTSFEPKGKAVAHFANYQAFADSGTSLTESDLILLDDATDIPTSDIEVPITDPYACVVEYINLPDYTWLANYASINDGYQTEEDDSFYVCNSDQEWVNMGNITGAKGDDAEFDRMVVKTATSTVNQTGAIVMNFSCGVQHIKGSIITDITNLQGYSLTVTNNKSESVSGVVDNNTITATYSADRYNVRNNPITSWVARLYKNNVLVEEYFFAVNFEVGAVFQVKQDAITAAVAQVSDTETEGTLGYQVAQLEITAQGIESDVSAIQGDYVTNSTLSQTAQSISLSVTSNIHGELSQTGIDVGHNVINLIAGKVNFMMDSTTPNAKISINPSTGALNASEVNVGGTINATGGTFTGEIIGNGLLIKDGNNNTRVTIKPNDLPAALTEAFFQSYLGYGGLLLGGNNGKVYARFDVNGVEFRYGEQETYNKGATGIKIGIGGIQVPYKLSSDYLSVQNYVPYDGFQQGIKVLTESDFVTAEAMYCGTDVDYRGRSKVYLVQPSDSVLIVTDIANTGSSANIKYGICLGDGAGTNTNNSSNTVKPRIGRKIKIINATAGNTYIHVFGGGNIWMNNDSRTMSGYKDVAFGGVDNFLFLGTYMDSNRPSWLCEPYYR